MSELVERLKAQLEVEMPDFGLAGTPQYTRTVHAWKAGSFEVLRGQLPEIVRLIEAQEAERERLIELLDELQAAETAYRYAHDHYGASDSKTGRAWDLMRRRGNNARKALKDSSNAL